MLCPRASLSSLNTPRVLLLMAAALALLAVPPSLVSRTRAVHERAAQGRRADRPRERLVRAVGELERSRRRPAGARDLDGVHPPGDERTARECERNDPDQCLCLFPFSALRWGRNIGRLSRRVQVWTALSWQRRVC